MRLELKKFGNILSSRPAGRDAWLGAQAYLFDNLKPEEKIEVDFFGVAVLSPSWADEFIMSLYKNFPGRLTFINTNNASVKATLEFLEKINNVKFNIV